MQASETQGQNCHLQATLTNEDIQADSEQSASKLIGALRYQVNGAADHRQAQQLPVNKVSASQR